MDPQETENKNSDNSIELELLPMKSKETSEIEDSANISSENLIVNQSRDTEDEKNDDATQSGQPTSVSKVDEKSLEDNEEGNKEIVTETLALKDDESKVMKESSLMESNNSTKFVDNNSPKIEDMNKTAVSPISEIKDAKRKRRTPSDQQDESSVDDFETKGKRVKTKSTNDNYCWRCHKDSVDAKCSACPRSWHRKCMGGASPTSINETWICGECATILRAENAETRSERMAHLSIDQLCMVLKYIVECMRSYAGSEPFWKAVDLNEVPNYLEYVVRPMDLNVLESNVRAKLYGSTDAFMADAKWIQHNCIVFNTCGGVYADMSKLTNAAKQIIKTAKQEVAELEACPDCYVRGRNLPRPTPMWFVEACRQPHPLIWAKLKGFPFWPAKAMPRVNGQGYVDVRFFGQHDRAWVAPKDLYLYSRDPPAPLPRKRKVEMAECIKEITRHCRKLEMAFGPFQFAPSKTPYNPQDLTQIKILLPQYDPLRPNNRTPSSGSPSSVTSTTTRRKSPFRKRSVALRRTAESDTSNNESTKDSPTKDTTLTKNEPPSDSEKPNDTMLSDTSVAESPRPKKRLRKSLNSNDDNKNTTEITDRGKETSPPIRAIEISSTCDIEDTDIKDEPISNGSPEVKSPTIIKITNQSKLKNERTIVPLEKSLAALLRKVNPKARLSHTRGINSKGPISHSTPNSSKIETKTSLIKVYKPKARMVDKVNAEKALKSTFENEHGKPRDGDIIKPIEAKVINGILTPVAVPAIPVGNSGTNTTAGNVSLLHNKRDNNIIITNSLLKIPNKKIQPRILVLNNGTLEPKQTSAMPEETRLRTEGAGAGAAPVTIRVKPDAHVSPQMFVPALQKKQSRAKKSFPNKAPRLPQLLPKLPKPPSNSLDTMVYIPAASAQINENGLDYQLAPPEAGPVTAQLHRSANEMMKRMAQLMEEAIKEAADTSSNEIDNSIDTHQATIHSLRLQIERMQWQHQQQLAELKHNTDRTLREMRASLEAERLRAVEETRKEAEEEKNRCIDETKAKQWCSQCGCEALFYCCWNTAYCDHLCQQAHWQSHQRKCAQKPSFVSKISDSGGAGDSSNKQQQRGSDINKGISVVGTTDGSILRSACLSQTVISKNLKIP